jgi:hypothetical protein
MRVGLTFRQNQKVVLHAQSYFIHANGLNVSSLKEENLMHP